MSLSVDEITFVWARFAGNFAQLVGRPSPVLAVPAIVAGVVALLYGRRFSWLYAALLGFLGGLWLGPHLIGPLPGWLLQSLVLGFGVVAALIGAAAHGSLVPLVGALAMAGIGYYAGLSFRLSDTASWTLIGAGLVLGAVLARWARPWLLIIVSAFYGASALMVGLRWTGSGIALRSQAWVFLGLLVLGLVFQTVDYLRGGGKPFKVPRSAGGVSTRSWRRRGSKNAPPPATND